MFVCFIDLQGITTYKLLGFQVLKEKCLREKRHNNMKKHDDKKWCSMCLMYTYNEKY